MEIERNLCGEVVSVSHANDAWLAPFSLFAYILTSLAFFVFANEAYLSLTLSAVMALVACLAVVSFAVAVSRALTWKASPVSADNQRLLAKIINELVAEGSQLPSDVADMLDSSVTNEQLANLVPLLNNQLRAAASQRARRELTDVAKLVRASQAMKNTSILDQQRDSANTINIQGKDGASVMP